MTTREQYEEWFIKTFDSRPFPPASAPAFDFCWAGYQAGAASRDAEIAEMVAVLKSMMNDYGLVLLMRPDQIERNNYALAKVRKPT